MGAWACATCAERLGLDGAGNATAERGLCAAGGHEAREVITWYDGLSESMRARDLSPSLMSRCAEVGYDEPRGLSAGKAPISAAAVTPEGQMDMFGPNHEPLRGGA